MVKQEINAIVKNIYFKLSANNITSSILEEFFLEKIKNNIKADALFLFFIIKEVSDIKKINVGNGDKNMSATISLVIKKKLSVLI